MMIIDLNNPDACDNIPLHAHSWNGIRNVLLWQMKKTFESYVQGAAQLPGMNCH